VNDRSPAPYPQYQCAECGKELPLTEARLTVTCDDHQPERGTGLVTVRSADADDRHEIEAICDQALGETEVDAFGRTFDVLEQLNMIAEVDGEFAGVISLALDGGDLGIVLLSVYPLLQGRGVGSALLREAEAIARGKGLACMKIVVSNDDVPSFSFYQRHGFIIDSIARGILADRYGSAEPGFSGIPVRDEIRLIRPVAR
jgi:ribosomal protein S18 acetylase RimI-like enzyme